MNKISQFLCSVRWVAIGGVLLPLSAQATTPTENTAGLLPFLGQQIGELEKFNAGQAIKAVPLQYLGSTPELYDKVVQVPEGCPPEAFVLLAVYDTEIALRRSERGRFLHLADFLYKRLVIQGDDLGIFASSSQETALLDVIRSHAACLMHKAGHQPLNQISKEIQSRWNVRLRVAERINDLSFHQRVQEILTLQDDLEHIRDFLAHHITAFRANSADWTAVHWKDPALLKAAQIVQYAPGFDSLKKEGLDLFQQEIEMDYQERLEELWMDASLVEQIVRQEHQTTDFVEPLVRSMYKAEIEKFIDYLENLTKILQQPRNIYAVECGSSDRRTAHTCGLNSLLMRDALRGDVQSLRADSCSLIETLSRSSQAVRQSLNAALSKDPGRSQPLTLNALAQQSIQFESAGTSGFCGGELVQRPASDWFLNYKGRTIVQPGAVQADLLELVAYAHNYNLVVLSKKNITRSAAKNTMPTKISVSESAKVTLQSPLPALPVAKIPSATLGMRRQSQVHRLNASPSALAQATVINAQGPRTGKVQAFLVHPKTTAVRRESTVSVAKVLETRGDFTPTTDFSGMSSSGRTSLLDGIQSISIFSSYQEIRFLLHTPGHYQAAEFYAPIVQSLHYGTPTEWYQRKIKGILSQVLDKKD